MFAWLQQYSGTILVCLILAVVFGLLIRSLLRSKKEGKSSCCGGCAGCAMAGHCHPDAVPAAKDSDPADKPEEPTS